MLGGYPVGHHESRNMADHVALNMAAWSTGGVKPSGADRNYHSLLGRPPGCYAGWRKSWLENQSEHKADTNERVTY